MKEVVSPTHEEPIVLFPNMPQGQHQNSFDNFSLKKRRSISQFNAVAQYNNLIPIHKKTHDEVRDEKMELIISMANKKLRKEEDPKSSLATNPLPLFTDAKNVYQGIEPKKVITKTNMPGSTRKFEKASFYANMKKEAKVSMRSRKSSLNQKS